MTFHELAASRYSVRSFKPVPVEQEKLTKILEASRLAPTAHNTQPQRIKVINTAEDIKKMDDCTPCRYNSQTALLICYNTVGTFHRPDGVDSGLVDASIVLTHMMLAAQELGVYSCWVMMLDVEKTRAAYNIPDDLMPVAFMPLGYPEDDYEPNPFHTQRKPVDEVLL